MASDQSDIIWRRASEGDASDDVWDDSALIEAYDKAVSQIKDEISERHRSRQGSGKKKKGKKKQKNSTSSEPQRMSYEAPAENARVDWKVGDLCRAVFSEDHLTYEAEILELKKDEGSCLVKYMGYGNEEIVNIGDLLPSYGHLAKQHLERQKIQKAHHRMETNGFPNAMPSSSSHSHQHSSRCSSEQPFHPQNYNRCQHDSLTNYQPCTFPETIPQIPPPPVFPVENGVVPEEEALASMLMSWYMSGYHTGFYQGQKQRHPCNCRCNHMHR